MDIEAPKPQNGKASIPTDPPAEMDPKTAKAKFLNRITIGLVILLVALSGVFVWGTVVQPFINLAGPVVPSAERYYHINGVLEEIDYKNVGRVIEESYDEHQRSSSEARFQATIEGPEAFGLLRARLLTSDLVDCGGNETTVRCVMGRPRVDLIKHENNRIVLTLTDSGRGID